MQVLEALLRRHARDRPILVVAIDAASLERDAAWVLHHLPGLLHDASITWLCDGYRPGRSGSDGSDMPSTGAEERARFGWAALTQTEMKVARLISEGHTNRTAAAVLFVSANTISTHLKSVFAKLDVNSRVQLTRIVLQNTVADGSTAEKGHR
jgi:DNA-binding CsgD family transcriptional regulator